MEGRSQNPGTRRVRWAWAVRGASGLAVASAVSAATAADGPRAAVLLPPRVGDPAAAPVVARGAIDDDPLATTPVVRKGAPAIRPLTPPATGKAGTDWLSGVDPNVMPAGGLAPAKGVVTPRSLTPAKLTLDTKPPVSALPPAGSTKLTPPPPLFTPGEPHPLAKGVEAFKGFATQDGSATLAPAGSPQPDTRSPRDALQGTAPNGAPVLAGPPAWRWYGYGSVTPGANTYAPSGQYPRASANWYSVTKATPGAFPVPVVAPFRSGPGTEPPSYAGVTPPPPRPVVTPTHTETTILPPPRLNPVPTPAPVAAPRLGLMPTPEPIAAAPLPVPTMPSMAAPMPVSVAPPPFTPIPLPAPPALKAPEPLATTTTAPPAVRPSPPPILPPLSVMPTTPLPVAAPSPGPVVPDVAPVSVSTPAAAEDDVRWKSNPTSRPASPPPGVWVQPADRMRPAAQPGASAVPRLPIARGQIGDDLQEPADPVETIVQAVCRGRATGVDVRHTGPLQVTVCFETRTPTDATALVRDLSARPELARYEVNFCVLVK